jgi:predicted nucleic acid-binding protein
MEEKDRFERCQEIINLGESGEIEIWTSTINYAECFKKKYGGYADGIDESKDRALESFFRNDYIRLIQVSAEVGITARDILRKFDSVKKPNDGIHLASAVVNNIHEFHTFDKENLLPLNGMIRCIDGAPLHIIEPRHPAQQDLFPESNKQNIDNNSEE